MQLATFLQQKCTNQQLLIDAMNVTKYEKDGQNHKNMSVKQVIFPRC